MGWNILFYYSSISYRTFTGDGVAQLALCLTTNWTLETRSPAEANDFSSGLCPHTSSEAHPASNPVCTGGPFPRVKRVQGVKLTTHPI
jgi:hypothetical protein